VRTSRSLKVGAVAIAATLGLTLAACSDDDSSSSDTTETTEAAAANVTIVSVASDNSDFTTLVAAVKAAELVDTLEAEGPYTVFAPTNEAFEALPAGTVDELLKPENRETLASILTYHVVEGEVMAADLEDGQEVETVQGGILTVGIDGEDVTLTDENGNTVNVIDTDIDAGNGVIHVIDGVVQPASEDAAEGGEEATEEPGTIVDVAVGNEDFSTLVTAVTTAGLETTLSGEGPFTVFAPTNAAFDALPAGTLATLIQPQSRDTLTAILTYHVVAGEVMAADLEDGQEIETVQGETLTVGIDGDAVTLTDAAGNTVNVVAADVPASNGVIHVIDGVLLPTA
jgi:uncharacterized surface protein with fasciclin (FAS1) repeats